MVRNQLSSKEMLPKIAHDLMLSNPDESKTDKHESDSLVSFVQDEFKKELKQFYKETEFAREIESLKESKNNLPLDEQVLNLLANYSEGDGKAPQIARQLPKFRIKYKYE